MSSRKFLVYCEEVNFLLWGDLRNAWSIQNIPSVFNRPTFLRLSDEVTWAEVSCYNTVRQEGLVHGSPLGTDADDRGAKPCALNGCFRDSFLLPCFPFVPPGFALFCFQHLHFWWILSLAKLTTSGCFWLLITYVSCRINVQSVKVDYKIFQFIEIKNSCC